MLMYAPINGTAMMCQHMCYVSVLFIAHSVLLLYIKLKNVTA